MARLLVISILILSSSIISCSKPQGGVAPSDPLAPVAPPLDLAGSSQFNYGQTIKTSDNWEISSDFADSSESKDLQNGWKAEAHFE